MILVTNPCICGYITYDVIIGSGRRTSNAIYFDVWDCNGNGAGEQTAGLVDIKSRRFIYLRSIRRNRRFNP